MTTLERIIQAVSASYGDGEVQAYFSDDAGEHGDTLAQFIARELRETYDPGLTPGESVQRAMSYLDRARYELQTAIDAIDRC